MVAEPKTIQVPSNNGKGGDIISHDKDSQGAQINGVPFMTDSSNKDATVGEFVNASKHHDSISCVHKVFSWRYVMVILLHLSFMMATIARNCMPIALVCMTQTKSDNGKDQLSNISLLNATTSHVDIDKKDYEFSWSSEIQGLILSSASFLSFLAPLIANFIQPYIGHKNSLTIMTLASAIILFLSPVASRLSPWLLISLRTFLGGTFGANVPVIGDCVARWAPTLEKQTMITIIFTGLQTGGTLCSLLSGYLCMIPIDNGWPFIFYIIGALIVLWVIVWQLFSSVNPEDHKYISTKELQFIKQHRIMKDTEHKQEQEKPPYKIILTSIPVLALLTSTSIHYWTVIMIFTYMPIYLAAVLDFSVTETGLIMTVLSLARFLGMGIFTVLVNKMLAQKKWSTTAVKKSIVTIGVLTAGASLLPIILIDNGQRWIIISFFIITMIMQSSSGCIFPAVPLDLAPRYAGFLTGLLFSLGGFVAISAPLVVAGLTPNNTKEEWQKVWIICSCMFFAISLIFLLYGDCKIQPWAKKDNPDAPEVVSPFDPMRKRFSAAMNSPPIFSFDVSDKVSDINQVHQSNPVATNELQNLHNTTKIWSSTSIQMLDPSAEESSKFDQKSSNVYDGVFNGGFESERCRKVPTLNNKNIEQVPKLNNNIVIRF